MSSSTANKFPTVQQDVFHGKNSLARVTDGGVSFRRMKPWEKWQCPIRRRVKITSSRYRTVMRSARDTQNSLSHLVWKCYCATVLPRSKHGSFQESLNIGQWHRRDVDTSFTSRWFRRLVGQFVPSDTHVAWDPTKYQVIAAGQKTMNQALNG